MTGKQRAALLNNAAETLGSLERVQGALTKDQAVLYGAMTAIIDHGVGEDCAMSPERPFDAAIRLARDELSDADRYHMLGEDAIARDELRHAAHFIGKARSLSGTEEEREAVRDAQLRHEILSQSFGGE